MDCAEPRQRAPVGYFSATKNGNRNFSGPRGHHAIEKIQLPFESLAFLSGTN
jgi:hypothetical protein